MTKLKRDTKPVETLKQWRLMKTEAEPIEPTAAQWGTPARNVPLIQILQVCELFECEGYSTCIEFNKVYVANVLIHSQELSPTITIQLLHTASPPQCTPIALLAMCKTLKQVQENSEVQERVQKHEWRTLPAYSSSPSSTPAQTTYMCSK
jgi:hypothetical protein